MQILHQIGKLDFNFLFTDTNTVSIIMITIINLDRVSCVNKLLQSTIDYISEMQIKRHSLSLDRCYQESLGNPANKQQLHSQLPL